MFNSLKNPIARDTSINSPREIRLRLFRLLMPLSGALALFVAFVGWLRSDRGELIFAACSAIVCILLLATKSRWSRTEEAPGARPRPAGETPAAAPARTAAETRVLLIDASLAGSKGNSAAALRKFALVLPAATEVITIHLSGEGSVDFAHLRPALQNAQAFVFATGTHWDSWSSALQKFLEDATEAEGTALWLGKPAAVIVTEHSVGGKGVLSRLQGVLVTLGCQIPPMSGLTLAKTALLAARHAPGQAEDFWSLADLEVVAHNLLAAAGGTRDWKSWPVDRASFRDRWLAES